MTRFLAVATSIFTVLAVLPATAQAAASVPNRAAKAAAAVAPNHPVHRVQENTTLDGEAAALPAASGTRAAASADPRTIPTVGGTWTSIGPHGITNGGNSGRVLTLALNGSNLFLGSADGGIWRAPASDFSHWTPLTDNLPDLAIGSIVVDPTNSAFMYAGTGEFANSIDSLYGVGVYYSSDSGGTWSLGAGIPNTVAISAVAVDPTLHTRVYAAATAKGGAGRGLYVSTDSGHNWALVSGSLSNINGVDVTDLAIGLDGTLYVAVGMRSGSTTTNGIWTSLGGAAFTNTTTTIQNSLGWATYRWRLSLPTAAPNASQVIWAVAGDYSNSATNGVVMGVIESPNGGANWVDKTGGNINTTTSLRYQDGFPDVNHVLVRQAWYDLFIAASPTVPGTVFVGTNDIYETTTGSTGSPVWTDNTNVYGGPLGSGPKANIHPDQHAFIFSGAGTLYAGNDGGVFKSTNAAATWAPVNGDLALSQFYGGSIAATDPTVIMGGLQDNGTVVTTDSGGTWTDQTSGDGFYTAIDPTNKNQMYAEYPGGYVNISTNGPTTFANNAAFDPTGNTEPAPFAAPLILDPNDPATVYSGHAQLWKSTDHGITWAAVVISPATYTPAALHTSCFQFQCIGAIAVAPGDSTNIWVVDTLNNTYWAIAGSWFVSNGSNTCSSSANCSPKQLGQITGIAVDSGANPKPAYEVISGFSGHHVFKTADDGVTWSDITNGLPNIPFRSITVDPVTHNVFAGSDGGMFESTDGGTTWARLGSGLPNVAVYQTQINAGVLYAFTHGRAAWKLPLAAAATDHYLVAANPASVGAGSSTTVSVTAKDAGNATLTTSTEDVTISSSDPQVQFDATHRSLVAGVATFTATLRTTGSQTITATRTGQAATGSTAVTVTPGAATHFSVAGLGSANQGLGYQFTVTALDSLNNTATAYGGIVHFTSTDGAAGLPANYTFQPTDNGTRQFSVTFNTAPSATLTATDTISASINGTSASTLVLTLREVLPAVANNAYGGYTSAIYATNTGTATSTINFVYLDASGTVLPPGDAFTFVSVHAGRSARQDNGNGLANTGAGLARIYSDQPVAAFVNEFAPGGTDATSYTGVAVPGGVGTTLYAPTIANGAFGGYTTGIGLVNLANSATDITITYRNPDGSVQGSPQLFPGIPARAYLASYSGAAGLPASFAGSATITSTGGALIAAVVNETGPGNQFSSYGAAPAGSGTLYAPVMLRNAYGGYNTGLALVNTTSFPGTVTITYSNPAGVTTIVTKPISGYGFLGIYQGAGSDAPPLDGPYTAKIEVAGTFGSIPMIAGIVNEVAAGGSMSTSYNAFANGAVSFNLPLLANAAFASTSSPITTSVGVMNLGAVRATITITYYDATSGDPLTSGSSSVPAGSVFAISQSAVMNPAGQATAVVTGGGANVVVICNETATGQFMSYSGQ